MLELWKKGHLKTDCRSLNKKGDGQQETAKEANVAGDVLQDALILALDNTSDVRIYNPPLYKFGHMSKSKVMSKSGVHPVYL